MESKLEDSFTKWISRILQAPVTVADITSGKPLIDLANLTGDICIFSGDLSDVCSQDQFRSFLDGSYQFRASGLFCLESVINGSATKEELYGLCLLVLITCLQSQSKQLFIDAALDLDFETQNLIFHLLHEPMTQLSTDQHLTRESVVSGFHKPMPSPQSLAAQAGTLNHTRTVYSSTLGLPEQSELQTTPIKSFSNHPSTRQSWCGSHDMQPHPDNADPFSDPLCHSWTAGLRADPVCSSPIDVNSKKIDQPGGTVFRVPQFVCPRKVKPSESVPVVKPSHATDGVKMVNFTDGRDEPYTTTRSYNDFRYEQHLDTCAPCPSSSSPSMPVHYRTLDVTSSKPCRPTDLSLHVNTATHRYNSQSSLPNSMATSLADLSDYTSGHRQQLHHSLASPLTSVKHLLDSPLWAQKMRLRETERERRRLLGELDKERAYRDEVENVVAELRSQLDEARVRATEAEAKATRMSRDLAALQDQTDELNVCRSELALREDEIASLKQRLNSFQNLLSHSRKLEVENANLHQECADHRQKIEQLSGKLSEIKDRQLVCSEVETLRSKLRDVEAQLAQQLLDSENVQRDARRQQELLNQLKLQQSLTEKRRERNNHQVTIDVYTTNLGDTNNKLTSVQSAGNVSEIEFEDPVPADSQAQQNGPSELVTHKDASKMLSLSQDLPVVRSGENLGSVLETELQSANAHIVRLQNQLSCTLDKLSVSEGVIQDLTERVNHMTTDLSALSVQRELDNENANDFATLEARLAWSRVYDVNADANSEAQLKLPTEILDHLRNLGTGLSEPLDNLCHSIVDHFESAWYRLVNHQTTLLSSLDRAQADLKVSNEKLSSKASELNQALDKLNAQAEQHKQMKLTQEAQISSLELEKSDLQQQLHDKNIALTRAEARLHSLETEKSMLERSLSELKTRADLELNSSKQLLDQATQRLCELEVEITSYRQKPDQEDIGIQANDSFASLPITVLAAESLEHLDEDVSPDGPDEDLSPPCDMSHTAYEALAADRRGLSDELVRLHDELSEANLYAQQFEQLNSDLQQKLALTESALQQQTILCTRAQENWAIAERKDRAIEEHLTRLRIQHAAELEALRAELLPQISRSRSEASATAAQIEIVRKKFEVEREDFKRKLLEVTNELERITADRDLLTDRNADLQRELMTTRSLVESIRRNQIESPKRAPFKNGLDQPNGMAHPVEKSRSNKSVEHWLETTRAVNHHKHLSEGATVRGNGVQSTGSSEYSATEDESSHSGPLSFYAANGTNYTLNGSVDNHPGSRSAMYCVRDPTKSKRKARPHSIAEELARLTSRTAMLETVALALTQEKDHRQSSAQLTVGPHTNAPVTYSASNLHHQQHRDHTLSFSAAGDPNKRHSASVDAAATAHYVGLPMNRPNPASAPVILPTVARNHAEQDLDTDADSSAYTDLSQVSPVSRTGVTAGAGDLSRLSNSHVPLKSESARPLRDTSNGSRSVTTYADLRPNSGSAGAQWTSRSSPKQAMEINDCDPADPERISELHRRNRLQPMHLRTSYPVETQTEANHDGQLYSSAKSPSHPVSPPKQLTFTDENVNPPAAESVHANGLNSRRDEFLRPSVPAPRAIMTTHGKDRIRESQYGSGEDSEDSLSVASSVRSSHSSIAFEIPNEPIAGKSRRIPAPRPISGSSRHRGRGSRTGVSKRTSSAATTSENRLFSAGQTNVASLFLPSAIPNEGSFVSLETPLQRNPKCLNEPSHR
ncbi:hypothetical protein PHET_02861 [Paragonimus heterotremus]|uniref:Uncharacterized protein n=1 Tax=Paragonimus heterotremus TaxID=100268 RepID=A0A8J4TPA3_9TREM|nr:hypothetical protein PHET_02861 [Paragonimus heterotremus]